MLTKLTIRNFKRFDDTEFELGNPVVLIGPNNSGKTSAMQALTLWNIGVKRWKEKRAGKKAPERRPGVTINRRDLVSIPHPVASLLWRNLHVRDVRRNEGRQRTENIRIDLIVEGIKDGKAWSCGLEFDYANEESFYCRPLRTEEGVKPDRMQIPDEASSVNIAFLPPMSGLAATETRLDQGAMNVRVGEGRTAEILRNLCFRVFDGEPELWNSVVAKIESLFGATLESPRYIEERGEIIMRYRESGSSLDLSSSGRGLQQTLLILAYMAANPASVILLDEPDAHLEILRQRQIYRLITEMATEGGNQIIAASHSEVLLNEAAGKDLVVAFVGKPHKITTRQSQVHKALSEIGFDHYYQAQLTGWVLYLEGSTDLAILQALADSLGHEEAVKALESPFVQYVGNQPRKAEEHFFGLREAVPELKGVALFDRLQSGPPDNPILRHLVWRRWEIENYLCTYDTLERFARKYGIDDKSLPLLAKGEADSQLSAMREAIAEVENALEILGKGLPWNRDVKASEEFLIPLFKAYFKKLELPNIMEKKDFYELAKYIPKDQIDSEIVEKLDAIAGVAQSAAPSW